MLTRLGEETATRRLGFYDEFTTAHASEAFELGITSLVPLTATIEQFKAALLTRGGPSSATVGEGPSRSELARLKLLTPREVEVLQHLALGRRTRTIGTLLGITAHTVAAPTNVASSRSSTRSTTPRSCRSQFGPGLYRTNLRSVHSESRNAAAWRVNSSA